MATTKTTRAGRGSTTRKKAAAAKRAAPMKTSAAGARKKTARKAAPKAAAKRTAAKKATAKKATRKKAAPKKTAARKTAAKRTTRKKTTKTVEAQRLEGYMSDISKEIDRLGKEATKSVAKAEKEYNRMLGDLRKRWASEQTKLQRLVDKREEVFDDLKGGVESGVKELERSVRKAIRRVT